MQQTKHIFKYSYKLIIRKEKMIHWLENHKKISWLVVLIIIIIIFITSSIQSSQIKRVTFFSWQSFVYHFLIFFILAFFILISLIEGKMNKKNLILIALIVSVLYGISDEIHQYFVPGRCCSLSDILTDSAGSLTAAFFYSSRLRRKK